MKKMTLVSDVIAYIVLGEKNKSVFLGISGDKKQNTRVIKDEIGKVYQVSELLLNSNEFELIIKPGEYGPLAFVRNENFPGNKEDYWQVLNFKEDTVLDLLCGADNKMGVFSETMETVFDDTKVSFISKSMKDYNKAFMEMTRKLFVSTGKKTKKWIPGHRYDSEEKTYYYLGSFLSKKASEFDTSFYSDLANLSIVHLYIESLNNSEKTVSDVFKNNTYGEDGIKVLWEGQDEFPKCVDSGSALVDDKPSLYNLYPEILKNAENRKEGRLKSIFDTLAYQSASDLPSYSNEVKEFIEKIIDERIKSVIYMYWNNGSMLREDEGQEKKIKDITHLCIDSIEDGNIQGMTYYIALLDFMGINLEEKITEFLKTWDEKDLVKDFKTFHDNLEYFRLRGCFLNLYQVDTDTPKLKDLCGETLGNIIKEKIDHAAENFGVGIEGYNIYQLKRNEKIVKCVITIDDILETHRSEEVEKELIARKFIEAKIYFNQDKGLK